MSAEQIARARGGHRTGGGWWICTCPAHDDSSPSLGLRDGEHGLVVKCFAGCPRKAVLAGLGELGPAPSPEEVARQRAVEEREGRRRLALARDVWKTSTPAHETSLVAIYLATRQILIPVPASLRVHGALGPYGEHRPSGSRRPQMVGAVQRVGQDGIVAVHRTFLAADGYGKAAIEPQRMILGPARGGAVRFAKTAETLMVAEGIETALWAMQATGLPAWAALSTSGMKMLVLPPEVHTVIVLADHDEAGKQAAGAAAQRWLAEGRRVRVALPPKTGTDFNDILVKADAA